ncbi:hypothetical protein HPP92_013483 [Vanilla planifolia]|uniref:AAA+ ATPase domain-containing protein n=1 Tax=Vanilla planifolia TaxID=51239 RepID=A0A835UWS1_VANPL|nr:hypothetical protein HPP92_013483 [Vanilla planifolia]
MGRKDVLEKLRNWKAVAAKEELPFLRNPNFIGRKNELVELGLMLFGDNGLEWDNDFINLIPENSYKRAGEPEQKKNKGKGKESRVWKESKEDIELEYKHDAVEVGTSQTRKKGSRSESKSATDVMVGKGIACVSGESGIGKSELLLEFAYRHAQMYKMVLWIGGETRYIRSNYMNLLPLFGIDTSINNDLSMERNIPKNFDETEGEAIRKVRKELMRGIPYLLVIDNLERSRDWWDGRHIMELLPRFGGETHIIISTRHPNVVKIPSLRLSYLSGAEARSLMEGSLQLITTREDDVFGVIEERLRKLPLGLAIIGAILSECCANPPKLLEAINSMPYQEVQRNGKEGIVSRKNSFLVQLLDFLFQLFGQWKKHGNLAKRMVQVSCCFAPFPIPTSMLVLAADEVSKLSSGNCCLKDCFQMFTRGLVTSHGNLLSVEAASQMLVRFQIARFTRDGSILVHDIVRDYANQREGYKFASAMIRALSVKGCLPEHLNHIWAACFLVFKFNLSLPVVSLAVPDLLSFIRQLVIPLTHHSYTMLSNCNAVLDLLRHSTEALEFVENLIIGDANIEESMSFCFTRSSRFTTFHASPLIYQDLVLLRAKLLEIRTKFMVLCGQYEIGEQLCRTALNIKEAIYGWEHPETRYTSDVMQKLISSQVH